MSQGNQKKSVARRRQELELGLVSQEEFDPEQQREGRPRWIAVGEFCEQRQRPAAIKGFGGRQADVEMTQVARLTSPARDCSRHGLPKQSPGMNVERDDGQRRAGIEPAIDRGRAPAWQDAAAVKLQGQTGRGKN
jgi:hypothetical protein